MDNISKLVPEDMLTEVDLDPVLDGFHSVSKVALGALADVVFQDMEEAFVKFFQKEWYVD